MGCALYGAICRLPEYYPTRTEVGLFQSHRLEIAAAIGPGRQFVDLGAGDCCKAKGWLAFLAPSRYVAVDIAAHEIAAALERLAPDFPELELVGVATDFSHDARPRRRSRRVADAVLLSRLQHRQLHAGGGDGNFSPASSATAPLVREVLC